MLHVKGKVARQAHVDVPEGTVEEEFARKGIFGRYAHLYRQQAPTGWSRIEGELRPRALDLAKLPAEGDWLSARPAFLKNDDVVLRLARLSRPMAYHFRNADADELLFVHEGEGVLETDFGPIGYRRGDYLVIPRGTVYRLAPSAASSFLVVESFAEIGLPDKGILGQHALFDPAVIEVPTPGPIPAEPGRTEWELRIQREGRITRVFYPFHPIQTVGWKGDLTVWRLNVEDIRPVSSDRYHLPPTAHVTFVMQHAVVCTFLPRPLENGDPKAMKVPFFHSNIDFDEVLFYHSGDFFSRDGIRPGMVTFHPQGIHHGPQAKAVEASKRKTHTDEVAVMVDTRRPLRLTEAALACERPDYWRSWMPANGNGGT